MTSDPVGIDCSGDCSEDFNADTIVTLTAAADAESTFLGWAGSCTGANVTCQVTMDQARNVIAWFDLDSGSTGVCFITSFFD